MSRVKFVQEPSSIALEELVDGVARPEPEMVFYAKVDASLLLQADSLEEQEQWELRINQGEQLRGRMRVRRTRPASVSALKRLDYRQDQEQFIYTTKSKLFGVKSAGIQECNTEVTKDSFNAFKFMSDRGMRKVRACFAVPEYPGLKWEVDFFVKDRLSDDPQEFFEWVKIDLEATPEHPFPLNPFPKFPLGLSQIIVNQRDSQTRQESKLIEKLYDDYFIWSDKP
jgi:hypothetical protein